MSVMLPADSITEFHLFLSPPPAPAPLSVHCTGSNVHVVCHTVWPSCDVLQFQAPSLLAHHAAPSSPLDDSALCPPVSPTRPPLRYSTISPGDSIVAFCPWPLDAIA